MNQTVVLYSNIESVSGHELGHHKDFQRFDSDWEYGLANAFPPVKIYKEWQASQNAKKLLNTADKWQFERYLLPALFTYIMGGFYASKKIVQQLKLMQEVKNQEPSPETIIKHIKRYGMPKIRIIETLRNFGTINLSLYGGIGTYNYCAMLGSSEMMACTGFAAGLIVTGAATSSVLKYIIPYKKRIT